MTLSRRAFAEALGSFFLLAAVVGSGIMGQRLTGGDSALRLLANSLATGAVLLALIGTLHGTSGAHFNPAVSVALAWRGAFPWREVPGYVGAQLIGAFAGCAAAHAMFALPLLQVSSQARDGGAQAFSQVLATSGLIGIVLFSQPTRSAALPCSVAAYVTGAYWFTSSTCFANPAVTLARMTTTFTGIRPADVPPFLFAQALGVVAVVTVSDWMLPRPAS